MIQRKPKKCAYCREPLTTDGINQRICCMESAIKAGKEYQAKLDRKREKVERANDRQKRESMKTPTEWANEAQKEFNAVRRMEDLAVGYGCISCDTHKAVQWQAGHYMNVKTHKSLRFNPDNVHLQCSQCNCDEGGNKIEYRKRLIKRIGIEKVEALECDNEIKRWTIDELKAIKAEYIQKRKELQR